jgi:hypothetical protein
METLPKEIIDMYRIDIRDSSGTVIYGLQFDTNYIGVVNPKIREKTVTWDLISPGGSVVSLYKNIKNIHVSCL